MGRKGGHAFWRALGYLHAYRAEALGAFGALLLVSAANLVAPQLIRLAIDGGIAQQQPTAVVVAVAGLLAAAVVRGLANFAQGYLAERASQGVAYDLRNALFSQIERLSWSYFDRVETGQLITRLTNDVEQVRAVVGTGVVQLMAALAMLVGSAAVLVALNWRLALLALLCLPAILFVLLRLVTHIGPLFGRVQGALTTLNTILQEDLTGLRVVRAFGREADEVRRYETANLRLRDANLDTIRAFAGSFPLVLLFSNLGTLAVVGYGGWEVIGGRLTVGELVAFNTYLAYLLFPALTIGMLVANLTRAEVSAARIFEVLDAPVEVQDAPDAQPLPAVAGRIEYRDVHFRYPGATQEALRGVSFVIEPGQTVALVGRTGSGKTTAVNLLPRFYDPTAGQVLIDGHDVRHVTLGSLRSQVAMVRQEALLFRGTVRDNIAYGRPDATQAEVEAAARAAQADAFIRALPQGYDTVVGERGLGLSGGQRQRIAIARALLADRSIIVLDDSTSAVDAETEAALRQALETLLHDRRRTGLVITQRPSTLRGVDRILVFDDGRLVASGTHEELQRNNPDYAALLGEQPEGADGPHAGPSVQAPPAPAAAGDGAGGRVTREGRP